MTTEYLKKIMLRGGEMRPTFKIESYLIEKQKATV
jgi:hypothetical protein